MMKTLKTYKQLFENFDKISVDILMINASDWDYIERWLKEGGDINVKSYDGWSLLTLNTNNNYFFIVKDLLDLGADPNIQNGYGNTSLMLAKDTDMIKLLIDNNADWNITNNDGEDFVDLLDPHIDPWSGNTENWLSKEYPEKYQDYLRKKKANEFNL